MKNQDEDYAYGQWKQKRIDEGTWPVIGSDIPTPDKIQKSSRVDPNPHIPFTCQPLLTQKEAVILGIVGILLAIIILWRVFG